MEDQMRTTLAGLAAVTFLAVAGSQPAAAVPMANIDQAQTAANSNILNVNTNHHVLFYMFARNKILSN